MNTQAKIREFQASDKEAVVQAMVELQNFERTIEPLRLPGEEMAEAYIDKLLKDLQSNSGKIFIAERDSQLAGFIAVLRTNGHVDSELNVPIAAAYITDLVVLPRFRKQGVGIQLMQEVEKYAASLGVNVMEIEVLRENAPAYALYHKAGYIDYSVVLRKRL
jgi:ribosomal protein S18 acetylase RimI-like enzyme